MGISRLSEVYKDIDRSDPKELRGLKKARSQSEKSRRHDLSQIRSSNPLSYIIYACITLFIFY